MKFTESANERDPRLTIYPRSIETFYGTVLKGMRLWKRPQHEYCSRCGDFDKNVLRINELTAALHSTASDPEHSKHVEVIQKAGGSQKAWQELRDAQYAQPDLKKHVDWSKEQRAYLKSREENLTDSEALLQLDYGGFTDSEGKKVSVWSATVMTKRRKGKPEHIDLFFDAANQVTLNVRAMSK